MHTVFAQSAISHVASTMPIVYVRTVRNWEEITFLIVPVLYVENSEATTTRTVSVPSVIRGDSGQLPRAQEHCGKRIACLRSSVIGAHRNPHLANVLDLFVLHGSERSDLLHATRDNA